MTHDKLTKIEFAPGCFDDFEGTQEELNEMNLLGSMLASVCCATSLAKSFSFSMMTGAIKLSGQSARLAISMISSLVMLAPFSDSVGAIFCPFNPIVSFL